MVLVMCPQNSFLDPQGSVYMGERAENLKIRLVDFLSDYQGERIFFKEKHAEQDTFFVMDKTHSIVNTADFNVCKCFKGLSDLTFEKTRYSGFFGTTFGDHLKREHITSVKLVGVETQTSILFTAEELKNQGVDVTIIEPLIASRDDFMHGVSISIMVNYLGVRIEH